MNDKELAVLVRFLEIKKSELEDMYQDIDKALIPLDENQQIYGHFSVGYAIDDAVSEIKKLLEKIEDLKGGDSSKD